MDTQENVVNQDTQAATQNSATETTGGNPEVTPEVSVEPEQAVNVESAPAQVEQEPKAIQELKAQRKKRQIAEQEAAYWRGVAEASRKQQEYVAPPEVKAPAYDTPPKLEDYDDIETFEAENVKYIVRQAELNFERKLQQQKAEESTRQVEEKFKQRLADASDIEPDLVDIINDPTLPVSGDMANIIKRSDKSIELIKYLNLNRQAAQRLMQMSSYEVGYELGKIEAAFNKEAEAVEPPKKVSMAPEPIRTVTPVGITDPDPETMPIEEWMKKFGGPHRR